MLNKQIIIDGLKINYLISENFNSDKAVVFLHGWNSPAGLFLQAVGRLDNLLAVNLPGFGGSEQPAQIWGLDEYAFFLNELQIRLNIKDPTIVGHSFGGSVAVNFASRFSNCEKLILISPAIVRKETFKIYFFYIASKLFRFFFPFLVKKFKKEFYKKIDSTDYLDAGNMVEIYKKIIRQDLSAEIVKIKKPIVMIWGEKDQDTPLAAVQPLIEKQDNITWHIIRNAGHYCFLDNKDEFNRIFFKAL